MAHKNTDKIKSEGMCSVVDWVNTINTVRGKIREYAVRYNAVPEIVEVKCLLK